MSESDLEAKTCDSRWKTRASEASIDVVGLALQ